MAKRKQERKRRKPLTQEQLQRIEQLIRQATILRDNGHGLVEKPMRELFRIALQRAGLSKEQAAEVRRSLGLTESTQGRLRHAERQKRARAQFD
jgi:hypothetical protein